MPRPRKTISLCSALAASVFSLVCLATSARADDTAPDWLRAAAQEKLPEYDKDTNAVILLDETQTTVHDNGEIDTLHRMAVRLLRPEAHQDFDSLDIPFDTETKISYMKAWTITSTGHELAVGDRDAVERQMFNDLEYDDVKVKTIQIPEANPGNVVGFEWVQRDRPYLFEDDWEFQHEIPVRTARLILQVPAGWEFTTNWFNYPEQKPMLSGSTQYRWEVKDIPAIEVEPDMPAWRTLAGWMGLKYFPHDPAMRSKTTGSWNDIGAWYSTLTQSSRTPSPQIQEKVAALTAGLSDPIAKMRAITEYMQKNIRYFAVEIGIGGYQPHPAAEVFAHQFGDCKDKATLLGSMLSVIGIDSYYVLVHVERGVVLPNYPSMDFNHAILAIRLPDSVPSDALYSVVNDPKLGRLLIFDPTNEQVPLGYIPWYEQSSYGLVVAPGGGELISLPFLPGAANRLLRTATFNLNATGDLSGEIRELEWGGPAADERDQFLESQPSKRSEVLDHFLANYLSNFTLTSASIGNLDQYDQDLSLDYKFVSAGYANAAGDMLFLRPQVVGDEDTDYLRLFTEHKPRKYPIQFDEATRQDDVFDITLPAGYVVDDLPKPLQADCPYASYKSETTVTGNVLHYKRTFEVKDVMVPVEKLPEIRAFLQEVAADQRSAAVLKRVATATATP
jgi:hypothetical protein